MDVDNEEFEWSESGQANGLWAYDNLPFGSPPGICAAAGDTPMTHSERLSEYAGCPLYCKDETQNPTGTYKDRGSATSITYANEQNIDVVGTVSVGNMAMSTAATATSAGLQCIVLVPSTIPPERIELIKQYDPDLLEVNGDYGQLYYDALTLNDGGEVLFVNGDSPVRLEGYKTIAYEICDSFRPESPDAIVLPISSGGHVSGVWKGLQELRDAGAINEVPRLYCVQSTAVDPIARAYEANSSTVEPVEQGETIAYSISNGNPPSGNRALEAVRETGGAITSVSDERILEAKAMLAAKGGYCVEPASATTVAGIRKWTNSGEISPEETVVAVLTGTGFKEMGQSDFELERGLHRINRDELDKGVRSTIGSL